MSLEESRNCGCGNNMEDGVETINFNCNCTCECEKERVVDCDLRRGNDESN